MVPTSATTASDSPPRAIPSSFHFFMMSSFEMNPMCRYRSLPSASKKICVGIVSTPYCSAASGFSQTSMNSTVEAALVLLAHRLEDRGHHLARDALGRPQVEEPGRLGRGVTVAFAVPDGRPSRRVGEQLTDVLLDELDELRLVAELLPDLGQALPRRLLAVAQAHQHDARGGELVVVRIVLVAGFLVIDDAPLEQRPS